MTSIPFASFLAGSLLSLLLPVLLLIALVVWYEFIFRRHREPADASDLGRSGAEASGTGETQPPVQGSAGGAPGAAGAPGTPPPGGP